MEPEAIASTLPSVASNSIVVALAVIVPSGRAGLRRLRTGVGSGIPLWMLLGGLAGALLHSILRSSVLTYVMATLLVFAGITGLLGIGLKFGRRGAWIAGALSGLLGGLVGNQGGLFT